MSRARHPGDQPGAAVMRPGDAARRRRGDHDVVLTERNKRNRAHHAEPNRIKAVAAVVGVLAIAGPVAAANAAPTPSPVQGAYQAGVDRRQGGFAAGAAAAQSGWQAGANALQGSLGISPLGFPGFVNLGPTGPLGPLGQYGPGGGSGQLPTGWDAWNLGPTGPLGPGGLLGPGHTG